MALTSEAGNIKERYFYDAWGNRKDPDNWNSADNSPDLLLDRGYTGHEHLFRASLINMNGRMYDPIFGRMLSPDPIMQAPFNTQNHNRYSYVLNNPLKYTDPSGYRYAYYDKEMRQNGGGGYYYDSDINGQYGWGNSSSQFYSNTPHIANNRFGNRGGWTQNSQTGDYENVFNGENESANTMESGAMGTNYFWVDRNYLDRYSNDVNVTSTKVYFDSNSIGSKGLYDASNQILKALSYAYNYSNGTLPKSEMKRWKGKLTMVDLIKFGILSGNNAWNCNVGGYGVYTAEWNNNISVILKSDNALNISGVMYYDYGNYDNQIVLWLGTGSFSNWHTGATLSFPNTSSMNKAWKYITSPNSWLP